MTEHLAAPPHAHLCWADFDYIYIQYAGTPPYVSRIPIHSTSKAIEQLRNPLVAKAKREYIPKPVNSKALKVLQGLGMIKA